ncbi:MFS transporter [Brachybacterium hainanense]|uniref:MFS transporter n=1 Tax=Brachybacterium hainanense TaxID=1541174 RepID=A0ABV6RA91_9MICO
MDAATPLTPLRRNVRFQLLWAGAACSTLGTEITRLALPLALLALTGSAAQAGLVGATLTAALLLAQIPAGIWVDRHDRRRILLAAQAVQVLNAVVLVGSLAAGGAGLLSFVLFAAMDGVCAAFVGNARQVSIRAVVPIAQLRSAFVQEESRSHAGRVLGPAIGGLLYGMSLLAPYLATLVAIAAAWVLALLARVPRRPAPRAGDAGDGAAPATARRGMLAETWTALRWLLAQRGLRELCLVLMAMNFFGGGVTLALIVHIESLGGGSALTGFVLTGIGIGGLLGALASGRLTARVSTGYLALGVPAVLGVCLMLAALPLAPWWPFFPILTFSLVTPALNVAAGAVTAELVPEDMLGRVGSLLAVASMGLTPLGPLLGGVLAGSLGGGWALCIAGAGFLLTAGVGAASPTLRRFDAQG